MVSEDVVVVASWGDAFKLLYKSQQTMRDTILELKAIIMANGQSASDKLDAIVAVVSKLSVDVAAALTAATTKHDADLARIAELEALATQLESNDASDAAMIQSLKDTIDSMKASAAAADENLNAKLDEALASLTSLDDVVPDSEPVTP